MSDKSQIEWTDATWPIVTGCHKISDGCKHCYAERNWARLSANPKTVYYRRKFTDIACHPDRLDWPLRWRRPRMIFVPSMGDLFHESIPDEFLNAVFGIMAAAQHHTFQVLTKRPERMRAFMAYADECDASHWTDALDRLGLDQAVRQLTDVQWPPANIWLGVSVEDQSTADERIPLLLNTPAAVCFASAEPLLGPIDMTSCDQGDLIYLNALTGEHRALFDGGMQLPADLPGLDWVIAGGESGPKARPSHPDWVRQLLHQCQRSQLPFFFKQWGAWVPRKHGGDGRAEWQWAEHGQPWQWMCLAGKKRAGRELDGRLWEQYPGCSS